MNPGERILRHENPCKSRVGSCRYEPIRHQYRLLKMPVVCTENLNTGVVPTANQIRAYWWCSPPRIARQRMRPAVSTARDIGASLCNDK